MASALAAPATDAPVEDLVDWLELTAFFDEYEVARLDAILGSFKLQEDGSEHDIGDADLSEEDLRQSIENEVQRRADALVHAYPFVLSDDGEVLAFKSKTDRSSPSIYLVCLILSHVTKSAILKLPPEDGAVRDVRRRHFQIVSTLAVAGHVGGPALSLGWPRVDGGSILSVVARACDRSGTGVARATPGQLANPAAKDGGIDVLGWTPANDRPPPTSFWFGQAASGHGWADKSSRDEEAEFSRDYFDTPPQCNHAYVTICPFLVPIAELERKSRRHGVVLDRTRAPLAAIKGLELAKSGVWVEEVGQSHKIALWVGRYRKAVREAA